MKIALSVASCGLSLLLVLVGCTTYRSQEVPFRSPASYGNMQRVAGAQLASKAYVDKAEASEAFGFDIRSAGLLPVQVVFDNQGSNALTIVPEQSFLIDTKEICGTCSTVGPPIPALKKVLNMRVSQKVVVKEPCWGLRAALFWVQPLVF